jgi:peptide/nickel transport system permease protein
MRQKWLSYAAALLLALLVVAQFTVATPRLNLQAAFTPPSADFLLGATPLGQSVARLVILGAGQTLFISVCALIACLAFSLIMTGVIYILPRPAGQAYAHAIDAWLSIPGIFIALSIGFFLPQGIFSVMLALILSEFAALQKFFLQRLLSTGKSDYIVMAQVMGARRSHTLRSHVLPQLVREAGYLFFLTLPSITLSLASLEFLGVQTGSERLSLGMQIAIYKDYILLYPHLSLAPVICLLILLFALDRSARIFRTPHFS